MSAAPYQHQRQTDERVKLHLQSSPPGLINISAADVWGPIILCRGKKGCRLVHWRMFGSIPAFRPPDTSSTTTKSCQLKICPEITKHSSEKVPKIPFQATTHSITEQSMLLPALPNCGIRGAPTPSTKRSTSLLAHTDLPGFTFLLIHHPPLSGLLQYSTEGVPGTVRCLNMSRKAWRLQSHCRCKTDAWKAKDKGSPRDSASSCQLTEDAS